MNEQKPPVQPPPIPPPPKQPLTNRDEFNLITDTVAGPNVRLKDNLYQGLAILVCLVLGASVGLFIPAEERGMAVGIGAFVGLFIGLIGSGIFLMVYRAVKHARGQHD
jgi:hypothetical protein